MGFAQYSFDNADAWEENFIGMFLGGVGIPTMTTRYNAEGKQERGFGMAGGIFQEMKDRNIEIQRQRDHAEFLNKTKLDSVEVVKKTMQNAIEMHSLSQEQKQQIEEGNFKGAKDTEANMAFSFFKARHDTGRFESAVDNVVTDINNMTAEQFGEKFGYSDLTKEELEERKSKVVESFVKEANDVRDSIREVDRIAPTVSESIRTGLAHTLYRTRNSERRYNEIIDEVSSMLNGTVDAKKVQEAYALITQEYDLSDKRYKSTKERLAKLKTLSEKLQQLETPDPSLTVEQSIARNKEIKETLDAIADTFEKVKMDKNNTIAVRNVAETFNELIKFEKETNEAARQKLPASVAEKMKSLSEDLNGLVHDKVTLTSLYNYLFTKNGKENWDKITDELKKLMILAQSPEGQEKLTGAQLRKLEAALAAPELSELGKKLNLGILKDEAEIQIAKAKDA